MTATLEKWGLAVANDGYVVLTEEPRIYYGQICTMEEEMFTSPNGGCRTADIVSIDIEYTPIYGVQTPSCTLQGNSITIHTVGGDTISVCGRNTFFELRSENMYKHEADGDRAILVKFESLREFADIFERMVPNIASQFKYDVLLDRPTIHTSVLVGNATERKEEGFIAISDSILPCWYLYVEGVFEMYANYRKKIPRTLLTEYMQLLSNRCVNPFRDWLESLEWDGTERVDRLWRWMFGATSDGRLELDDEDEYLSAVAWDWLSGAVARQYEDVQLDLVPVFIGDPGIGKTTLIQALLPERVSSTDLDFADLKSFFDTTRGKVLIELGEGAVFDTQSPEKLKSFISLKSDIYRRPYDRFESERSRHWVLFVTSNRRMLLNDATGNRRFYPIYCDSEQTINRCDVMDPAERAHYFEQVWAEAAARVRDLGYHPTHYARNIKALSKAVQQTAEFENPYLTMIVSALEPLKPGFKINRDGICQMAFAKNEVDCSSKEQYAIKTWIDTRVGNGREWVRCNPTMVLGRDGESVKSRGFEKMLID